MPLVQSMHTLGKVKNAALAAGDAAEPTTRIRGELEVVAAADRLIANTAEEARQLTELYGADPAKVKTVNPGADLSRLPPGAAGRAGPAQARPARRTRWCCSSSAGCSRSRDRTSCCKAAAKLLEADPELRGPAAGGHRRRPERDPRRGDPDRMRELAAQLGISDMRPARAAVPAGRAGRLVPGRGPGAGAVALGVVRAGRARGSGVRHAGGGGHGRRAAHGGPGRLLRRPGGRPRPADWAQVLAGCWARRGGCEALSRARASTRPRSAGRRRSTG